MEKKSHFHLLLFSVALLFFNWPLISISMNANSTISYAYLFLVWLLVIALLFFTQKSAANLSSEKGVSLKGQGGQNV